MVFFLIVAGVSEQQRGPNFAISTWQTPPAGSTSVVCLSEGNGGWHCLHKPRSFHPLTRISQRNTLPGTLSIPEGKQTKTPSGFEVYHFKNIAIMMISPLEADFFLMDIVIVFKSETKQSHL